MPTIIEAKAAPRYFAQHLAQHPSPLPRKTQKRYIGTSVRKAISQVFEGLGGWDAMLAWAKDNPDLFYGSVVPKLLPSELAESGLAGNITVIVQRGTGNGKDTEAINTLGITQADEAGGFVGRPGVSQGNPSGTASHSMDEDSGR